MYKLQIYKSEYELFQDRLHELHPEINVHIFSCDEPLEELGFVESAPCTVIVDIDDTQIESLLDEINLMEFEAYDTSEDQPNIEAEAKYKRYECLWRYLFCAERVECPKDSAEGRDHG